MPRLAAGAVLSDSLRLVARHPSAFLATQGVPLLVAALLDVAVYAWAGVVPRFLPGQGPAIGNPAAFWVVAGVGLAHALLGIVGLGLGVVAADALQRGERIGLAQAWRALRPRLGNLLGTSATMGLFALVVLFVLGLLPIVGILLGLAVVATFFAAWWLAYPVSVLARERVGGNFDVATRLGDGAVGRLAIVALVVVALLSLRTWVELALLPLPPLAGEATLLLTAQTLGALAGGFLMSASTVVAYRRLTGADPSRSPAATPKASGSAAD